MRDLTLVLPHWHNAGMLAEQQRIWQSYPSELRAHLHVVVVDDCSEKASRPTRKAVTVTGLGSLRIYRLVKHIRWNWLACRNLGAKVATTEWLLLTDIDHAIPVETLTRLVAGDLDPRRAYRFCRVDAPRPFPYTLRECSEYKPHNDTWLMTKKLFFTPIKAQRVLDTSNGSFSWVRSGIYGYDERLSGCYGTSGEFKDRVYSTAGAIVRLTDPVIRYPREIIADASTHPSVYTRKNDKANDAELEKRKDKREIDGGWVPLHGLIGHEELYSSLTVEAVA